MKRQKAPDPLALDEVLHKPIGAANKLGQLIRKAKRINMVQAIVNDMLPDTLRPHVQVMNLTHSHAVLCANNGTYAGALRMHHDRLLAAINRHPMDLRLEGITIKVRPS